MRETDREIARRLQLFSDMDEQSFSTLMRVAFLQTFPPQVQLISEGEPADFLHVVVAGSVELFAQSNGRETTMDVVRPVATFILAAVLKDALYLMSARTLDKSRILMIPSESVRAVMASDPRFDQSIILELAACYRRVIKAHKDLKLRTGVERLANFLLRELAVQGGAIQEDAKNDKGQLTLPTDKRTLAATLGMTPENLSRAFGTLKAHGVEVNGADIRLKQLSALHVLAKPNPLIDDPDL